MVGNRKSNRRDSPSSHGVEGKSKRRRTPAEESGTKIERKDRNQSRKKHKSHKSSKHDSDKETKVEEKHKHKRTKNDQSGKLDIQEICDDDYFAKNNEFASWLKEERGTFFSDLSSESARQLFSHFVKEWNNQKLEARYYEGITFGPRTSHKWKIKH